MMMIFLEGIRTFERGHHQELQGRAATTGVKVTTGPPTRALQCGSDDTGYSPEQVRRAKC